MEAAVAVPDLDVLLEDPRRRRAWVSTLAPGPVPSVPPDGAMPEAFADLPSRMSTALAREGRAEALRCLFRVLDATIAERAELRDGETLAGVFDAEERAWLSRLFHWVAAASPSAGSKTAPRPAIFASPKAAAPVTSSRPAMSASPREGRSASSAGPAPPGMPRSLAAVRAETPPAPAAASSPEKGASGSAVASAEVFASAGGPVSLLRLPAALPPPPHPKEASPDDHAAWLRGVVRHPLRPALASGLLATGDPDDFLEIDGEFLADPISAAKSWRTRAPARIYVVAARRLRDLGRDAGPRLSGSAAAERLAAVLRERLPAIDPAGAETLRAGGAVLHLGEALADAVAAACDIEALHLAEGPSGGTAPQDLRGAISPMARLDRPVVLERAVHRHFVESAPFALVLLDALDELRLAQLVAVDPDLPDLDAAARALARDRLADLADLAAAARAEPAARGAAPPDAVGAALRAAVDAWRALDAHDPDAWR